MRKKKKGFTIGVFTDYLYNEYEKAIVSGISQFCYEHGIKLVCFNGGALNAPHFIASKRNMVFDLASSESIDGLILISATLSNYIDIGGVTSYLGKYVDIPVVNAGIEIGNFASVTVDNEKGMKELLVHLIEKHGYRRIAYVYGPEKNMEMSIRFKVYREVLDSYGIPIDENLIVPGHLFSKPGKQIVHFLIDEKKANFDCIFAGNDVKAEEIITELENRGIKVPENIAVVGFDNKKEGRYLHKPLTTVSQPEFDLGYKAAEYLLKMLNGEDVQLTKLPTCAVFRNSCGCSGEYSNLPNIIAKNLLNIGQRI